MSQMNRALALAAMFVVVAVTWIAAQSSPQTYKGLELVVSGVERASNVSLTDCPPGANIVRGVIKPGDPMEFASVKVDFKVLPAFKPGPLAQAGSPRPGGQDVQHRAIVCRHRRLAVVFVHVLVPCADGHRREAIHDRHGLDRPDRHGEVAGRPRG